MLLNISYLICLINKLQNYIVCKQIKTINNYFMVLPNDSE